MPEHGEVALITYLSGWSFCLFCVGRFQGWGENDMNAERDHGLCLNEQIAPLLRKGKS